MARQWWRRRTGDGATGTSGPARRERGEPVHGGSAFHAWWGGLPAEPLAEVAATLTVVEAPSVARLYFWALQASFAGAARSYGAAHTGLQWNPRHPGCGAVNWGGYANGHDQGVLPGTANAFDGFADDQNTRHFPWQAGRPYRFAIRRGEHGWLASVDGTPMRELLAAGDRLTDPVVWAEVFCACDQPRTVVHWGGFEAATASGRRVRPDRVRLNFPPHEQGDCENTDIVVEGDGLYLLTTTRRAHRSGEVVALG